MRVVVTRAVHQAEELARPLREQGAEVILLPLIGIAPPANPEPLRAAAAASNTYDWVLFTSANAVSAFANELRLVGQVCNARVAVIGSATRDAAQAHGFRVEVVPEDYVAESLIEAFGSEDVAAARILMPSAAITRDVAAPELRRRGAHVDVIEAYRNILPPEAPAQARAVFQPPYPDWVTFASSSAVTNIVKLVGTGILNKTMLASIGPVTSNTARQNALTITAEARNYSVDGLVDAIVEHARAISL